MRKTKKAASSRIRMNKYGKMKHARPGRGHLLTGKSRSRKRHLGSKAYLVPSDAKRVREFFPNG